MRIHDKLRALINPWFLFTISIWMVVLGMACAALAGYTKNLFYKSQMQELISQFNVLQVKNEQLRNSKFVLNIDDEHLSTILSILIKTSREAKVGLGEISIGTEIMYGGNNALPLTISIKGSYNQIGRFINYLEREDVRFQFTEIELSTKETQGLGIIGKIRGYFIIL